MKIFLLLFCMVLALILLLRGIMQMKQGQKLRQEIQDMQVFAQQADEVIKTIEDFIPSMAAPYSLESNDITGFLYIDNDSQHLCLVKKNLSHRFFDGNDVLTVSIIENDAVIIETHESTQTNSKYVNNLHVVIQVNDATESTLKLSCLTSRVTRTSIAYQNAISAAKQWQELLNSIRSAA